MTQTTTRKTTKMTATRPPLELLQGEHRRLLNLQAEIATRARQLAADVDTITAELTDITTTARNYATIIAALTRTTKPPEAPTTPQGPRKPPRRTPTTQTTDSGPQDAP